MYGQGRGVCRPPVLYLGMRRLQIHWNPLRQGRDPETKGKHVISLIVTISLKIGLLR